MNSLSFNSLDLEHAVKYLQHGKIIAYPTEAVYGLGCDPFNFNAVNTLLELKNRHVSKGLILIASTWEQIESLILPLKPAQRQKVAASWPGPTTWVFPATNLAPDWITGNHNTIAIRFSDHPIAKGLCELFQNPIVSTSANLEGKIPARNPDEVIGYFNHQIDFIVQGDVGNLDKPTPIRDIVTEQFIRS